MRRLLTVAVAVVMLSAGLCWGGTIYVTPDGTGDAPTIGAAMDSAAVGDTLLLASGTFIGAGNQDLTVPAKNLVIKSETGDPADCVIDCQGLSGVHTWGFQWSACNAVIEGLTVTNATGAALNLSESAGSATVRNCAFIANGDPYWGDAGAIRIYGHVGDVVITDCEFVSNENGAGGGAVYISGVWLEVTINRCTFSGNSASYGGAILCEMHEAMAYIRNSVFYGNSAVEGGGILVSNMYTEITGCTFIANTADEGSGIWAYVGEYVNRCIVAYGSGGCGFYHVEDPDYYPGVGCTDIYGNEGGDWVGAIAGELGQHGNFSAPPGFCYWEAEPYDLHLCSGSLCLPGNHPDGAACGLIGALGQGCECGPTAAEPTTWGAIKAMYK